MLIDCDNFFVSCERAFNPSLRNKPVVVLSNNDGCVIARSNEAKNLGIKMGIPFYQVDKLLKHHKGTAISSNYELYADLSRRIMTRLTQINDKIEIYSIDEAFIQKDIISSDANYFAKYLRSEILKTTGISVSIGIAKTKTLCKIASKIAKKNNHIFQINEKNIDEILKKTPINEVWGIGDKTSKKLKFIGIFSAYDLKQSPLKQINILYEN
jgi:DNA polymerase V